VNNQHASRDFYDRRDGEHVIWPNFFIVGAANSGTTSMYAVLRQHPQVFLPALKEPHFFAQIQPSYEQRYLRTLINDQGNYLKLFHHAGGFRAIGEASPSYLWSREAPKRIRQKIPHAKIIVLLRDPVERAYSHYLMNVREGLEDLSLFEALQRDWTAEKKGWSISHLYVELGLYADQVGRFIDTFGRDQVRIVMFDELTASMQNGKSVIAETCEFLGLDSIPVPRLNASVAENGFGVARWEWARRMAGSNLIRRAGQLAVPSSFGANHAIKRLVFQRYFVKAIPKPPIDQRAKEFLCSLYEPDVHCLEQLLGCKLARLRRSWY
jgi:hypothetical protein